MKRLTILALPVVIGMVYLSSTYGCKSNSGGTTTTDSTATMAAKNRQTALAVDIAVSKHDPDGVVKDCTADVVDYADGSMKAAKGPDSVKAGIKEFFAAFPDVKGENLVAAAQGDTVIVTGDWSGTFKGDMGPIKATGKPFKVTDADIYVFNKQGKIISHRSVQSMNTYLASAGATMPSH
jgi:predicted ester cyclase